MMKLSYHTCLFLLNSIGKSLDCGFLTCKCYICYMKLKRKKREDLIEGKREKEG